MTAGLKAALLLSSSNKARRLAVLEEDRWFGLQDMHSRRSSEFAADPVTTKPVSRAGLPEPVSPPHFGDSTVTSILPGSNSLPSLHSEGSGRALSPTAYHMGLSPNTAQGSSSLLAMHDSYAVGAASMPPAFGSREWQNQKEWQTQNDWQNQNQYQQLVNQHALLNQLQSKMQASQIAEQSLVGSPNHTMSNPQPLASLLSQQLHTPAMQEPAFHSLESRATYPVSHTAMPIQWPARLSQPRSPPSPFAGSPSPPSVHSLPDHPGLHGHNPLEDRRNSRGHMHGSAHSMKGRPVDMDSQSSTIEKLRREISRLQSEVDRLEKEVARQKSLRETERIEFTDAKDRVRHSWAVDRDDFARVKSLLKTKNAEHHAQSGRLSQQLKEAEVINRGLKELCTRHGIAVPPELEITHSRRHSLNPGQRSSQSAPSLPGSQNSVSTLGEAPSIGDGAMTSRTPSEVSFDSDFPDRLAAARAGVRSLPSSTLHTASSSSPLSPATAVLQMMQQLQQVVSAAYEKPTSSKTSAKVLDFDSPVTEPVTNEAATQAAVQAAAALSQLATALSSAKLSSTDNAYSSRSSSPCANFISDKSDFAGHMEDQGEELGQFALTDTNLNRMSLQAWVNPNDQPSPEPSDSSRSCSPHPSVDGKIPVGKPAQVKEEFKAEGERPEFSLSRQSYDSLQEGQEIQMWPAPSGTNQNGNTTNAPPKPL